MLSSLSFFIYRGDYYHMFIYFHELDIGKIGIAQKDDKITNLYFYNDDVPQYTEIVETPLIKEAFVQLESYLAGKRKEFLLPLAPNGTTFMNQVWSCLRETQYGQTITYKEVAKKIGSPKAARAVGLANNRNPIPVFIPCHRVIGADGSLTGYRGGLELKKKLLALEQNRK